MELENAERIEFYRPKFYNWKSQMACTARCGDIRWTLRFRFNRKKNDEKDIMALFKTLTEMEFMSRGLIR